MFSLTLSPSLSPSLSLSLLLTPSVPLSFPTSQSPSPSLSPYLPLSSSLWSSLFLSLSFPLSFSPPSLPLFILRCFCELRIPAVGWREETVRTLPCASLNLPPGPFLHPVYLYQHVNMLYCTCMWSHNRSQTEPIAGGSASRSLGSSSFPGRWKFVSARENRNCC